MALNPNIGQKRLGLFLWALKRKKNGKCNHLFIITKARRKKIFQLQLFPTLLYPFVWAAITDPYAKWWKIFFKTVCLLGRLLSLFYWQLWNHHWVCRVVILQMVCMGGLFLLDEVSLWTWVWIEEIHALLVFTSFWYNSHAVSPMDHCLWSFWWVRRK